MDKVIQALELLQGEQAALTGWATSVQQAATATSEELAGSSGPEAEIAVACGAPVRASALKDVLSLVGEFSYSPFKQATFKLWLKRNEKVLQSYCRS